MLYFLFLISVVSDFIFIGKKGKIKKKRKEEIFELLKIICSSHPHIVKKEKRKLKLEAVYIYKWGALD